MARNLFTEDEIVLCTYAALFDADDFGGKQAIYRMADRPESSIDMKIRNIEAMLDAYGIARNTRGSGLTGRTTGEDARRTNWEIVEPLTSMTRPELLLRCQNLLTKYRNHPTR